jgi:hypothetical protein
MKARSWAVAVAVALICAARAADAETAYVIEQLVVSVNSTPDGNGERVASIKSGDRVDVLERQDEQAHIRLGNGLEGWVKGGYLSNELPLQQRLAARGEELASARADVSRLESELATARTAAVHDAAPEAQNTTPSPTPVSNPPLFDSGSAAHAAPSWGLLIGTSVLALALGFLLGWRVLDRRIRRKYGGLKIY